MGNIRTFKRAFAAVLLTTLLGLVASGGLIRLVSVAGAVPEEALAAGCCCCAQIVGDHFVAEGQRYPIQGLNYYEKDHPWDLFWPALRYEARLATVAHEFNLARDLGVNTLRVFLRWQDFTTSATDPTVPLWMKVRLDIFLDVASARHMKVLLTLFDGMPNEGPESLYRSDLRETGIAHLDSLLAPFTNRQGDVVDLSTDRRILAWDVKNEPDRDYERDADGDGTPGTPEDRAAVQAWVNEIIAHLRDRDPCHPITVGIYGAVGSGYDPALVGDYAGVVDFLSVHYSLDEKNLPTDLDAVKALAGGKPIVVEEFGLHTWADDPVDPHRVRDQAAYLNAVLSSAEAQHLAGTMLWTLTDFSYLPPGMAENQKHQGILHNATVTTTEVPAPLNYDEKPAAAVVRQHFRPSVAYLDTLDGYALVTNDNCDPPLGWADNRAEHGATIMACGPAAHAFAPSQSGQARLTMVGADAAGLITSTVLEAVDVARSPQLAVEILTYTVRDTANNLGPVELDIGVKASDETTPTWLATGLVDASVDSTAGLRLPQTIHLPLPAAWPPVQDFQIVLGLRDHLAGNTGYSAGFELGSVEIGACPLTPSPRVELAGRVQELFRDGWNGRAIDPAAWTVVHGTPYLLDCGVVLTTTRSPGVPSKTELRSRRSFAPTSMLVIGATTQNWRGENKAGDTSFGFEGWEENCHYAVIVTSDGQLALIRPAEGANCSQPDPPTRECYRPIQDWDTLRTAQREFAILWTATSVTLTVDGGLSAAWHDQANAGCATPAIPQVPLPIRLNANVFNEDRARQPGEEDHYDRDVLQVDYLYVPGSSALPVVWLDAIVVP
jgi:hypothetical protein